MSTSARDRSPIKINPSETKRKAPSKRREPEPITLAEIMRSPMLQRPGVALPSDGRARDIVARLALAPVPELVNSEREYVPEGNPGAPKFGAPAIDAPRNSAPEFAPVRVREVVESRASHAEAATERKGASFSGAPNIGAPSPNASPFNAPFYTAPQNSASAQGDNFSLEEFVYSRSRRTPHVYPVNRIQDAFTSQEQRLLEFLWHRGKDVPGLTLLRLAGGGSKDGARVLAVQAGVAYSTFQVLTKNLRDKFGLDIVQPGGNFCKVYAIYHFSAILERQRRAGYFYYSRQNGGGRLLTEASGRRCPPREDMDLPELKRQISHLKSGALIFGAAKAGAPHSDAPNTGALMAGDDAPKAGAETAFSGAPNFAAPIGSKIPLLNETTSTTMANSGAPYSGALNLSAPGAVADAILERTSRMDPEAARTLVRRCAEVNATVTEDEIVRLVREFFIPKSSTNPVGLLISVLPKQCESESLETHRSKWGREADAAAARAREELQQAKETAQDILREPENWDERTVQWARETLAAGG